jgi:hypothetical protein
MTCAVMAWEVSVVVALQDAPVQLQLSPLVPAIEQDETSLALHEIWLLLPDWRIAGTAAMSPAGRAHHVPHVWR